MTLMREDISLSSSDDPYTYEVQKSKCPTKKRRALRMVWVAPNPKVWPIRLQRYNKILNYPN